jgi:hypothetical protein
MHYEENASLGCGSISIRQVHSDQAEGLEDGEGGFQGDVAFSLLEAVDGRAADAGEDRQLLLREVLGLAALCRFFDKAWPIKLNVPFHLLFTSFSIAW